MTARYEIRQLLSKADKPLTHVEIIKHVVGKDYNVNSTKSALAKMECIGEVINSGVRRKPLYTLNTDFKPKEIIRKEKMVSYRRNWEKPKSQDGNGIFTICRRKSRIYKWIDLPLQAVRQ